MRFALLALLSAFAWPTLAEAVPVAICLNKKGDCPTDTRPPVAGETARRNLVRDLYKGDRVIDRRNGDFIIIRRPRVAHTGGDFKTVARGYCTSVIGAPDSWSYVHIAMEEEACLSAGERFDTRSTDIRPFSGVEGAFKCASQDAVRCAAVREHFAALVKRYRERQFEGVAYSIDRPGRGDGVWSSGNKDRWQAEFDSFFETFIRDQNPIYAPGQVLRGEQRQQCYQVHRGSTEHDNVVVCSETDRTKIIWADRVIY